MNAAEFADQIGAFRRQLAGLARRMVVKLTDGGIWQLAGHSLFEPATRETVQAVNFPGIGIAARPPVGGAPEAVVIQIGGANNPAIVALRDEATRSASAGDLESDEVAIFNTTARVRVRANGTIEIASIAGLLVEPTLRGTTYRAAEDMMLTALAAYLTAAATAFTALGQAAAATAATAAATAITTFQGAASTYVTTVARVE